MRELFTFKKKGRGALVRALEDRPWGVLAAAGGRRGLSTRFQLAFEKVFLETNGKFLSTLPWKRHLAFSFSMTERQ